MTDKYEEALSNLVSLSYAEMLTYKYEEKIRECELILQELVDKATPTKAHIEGDGYSNGKISLRAWYCPNCNESYEIDYQKYNYCPNCGQKLDWSDEGEEYRIIIKFHLQE